MHGTRLAAAILSLAALTLDAAPAQTPQSRQIGQVVLQGVPEWDDAVRQRLNQYLQVRTARLLSVAGDGKSILITTRFADAAQLHLLNAPLGMRRQITFFDEPVFSAFFVPGSGSQRIVFRKDTGGDEFYQIFTMDLKTGRHNMLTDGRSRYDDPVASRSGRYLAFCGTARNNRDFDIYLADLAAGSKPKLIWEVDGAYYPAEFSPDESKLLVIRYVSARETHWSVLDVQSGQHSPITPPAPPVFYGGGAWSHKGDAVYFTSDRDGEFRKLYRLDFEYGEWRCLTSDIDWDVNEVAVDPTGKGLAFTVNQDGVSKLYFADEWGNGRKPVADLPTGIINGLTFAETGAALGLTVNSSSSPADAYAVSYPDGKPTRWTQSEIGGLNPDTFVEPTLIRFPTFDKLDDQPRMVPAFVYKPRSAGPHPVVIYPHGGPESQFRPRFSSRIQTWVNELGLAVIAPNVRGSTGYGRSYHQLDNGVKRADSIKDIGALLDWIAAQPDLDARRVGIYGGSYGGYMVLGSLTNFPDRFKAGIDVVGIADFVTFLENTKSYRRDLRRAEYGDERDPEVRKILDEISPLKNAHKIKAALLVTHGKNDPRVPVTEAEQIVAKLRELNRPVWYALALNEGHGFRKKSNRDLMEVIYAVFWQQHLK
jgi:dipeptidyl aminopeptidase/acylaminoacyl peptidase